jgi:hypothetical protein
MLIAELNRQISLYYCNKKYGKLNLPLKYYFDILYTEMFLEQIREILFKDPVVSDEEVVALIKEIEGTKERAMRRAREMELEIAVQRERDKEMEMEMEKDMQIIMEMEIGTETRKVREMEMEIARERESNMKEETEKEREREKEREGKKKRDLYNRLVSFCKAWFSKLTPLQRIVIFDAVMKMDYPDMLFLFFRNHFVDMTEQEFFTMIKKIDPDFLLLFLRSHDVKDSPPIQGLTPERSIAILHEINNRIDIDVIADDMVETNPTLLLLLLKFCFNALNSQQCTYIVRVMAKKADPMTLMKFLAAFFSRFTEEHRGIMFPAVKNKADPKELCTFFIFHKELLEKDEGWFHMTVEASDSKDRKEYAMKYLQLGQDLKQNMGPRMKKHMKKRSFLNISCVAIHVGKLCELGNEWWTLVKTNVNPTILMKFLKNHLADMTKNDFSIVIQGPPNTIDQLLRECTLTAEQVAMVMEKMFPHWTDRFKNVFFIGPTQEQIRPELDVIKTFLGKHFSKLTSEHILSLRSIFSEDFYKELTGLSSV